MSKLADIIRQYHAQGTSYMDADRIVEASFDARERYEDEEMDTLAFQCAYLDGIARSGWTQVDYEYVSNRADDTFNEDEYLKENSDGEYGDDEYWEQQEGEGIQGECDPAGYLGNPEAGGESVGVGEGFAGSVDFFDAEPCASSSPHDSQYEPRYEDSGCTPDSEAVN